MDTQREWLRVKSEGYALGRLAEAGIRGGSFDLDRLILSRGFGQYVVSRESSSGFDILWVRYTNDLRQFSKVVDDEPR